MSLSRCGSRPNRSWRPGLAAAVTGGLPCRWAAGDEAYGNDPRLAARLRQLRLGYVLAVACSHQVITGLGVYRVDALTAERPATAWQRMSAGRGAKGHRYHDWSFVALPHATDAHGGHHWLLIRRNRRSGELASYRCWSPEAVPLRTLVTVAGRRWKIAESFQTATTASAWTSTNTAAGPPGTAGAPWRSSPTRSSPPRPSSTATDTNRSG